MAKRQDSKYTDKLVVRMPKRPSLLPTIANVWSGFSLRVDASYLLVGELGELSRQVAIWIAESGGKSLTFLSRRGQHTPEASQLTEELAAMSCAVKATEGSVTNLRDAQQVASEARPPLVGVVQLAMVLRDGAFPQMTHSDWQAAMGPKYRHQVGLCASAMDVVIGRCGLLLAQNRAVSLWGRNHEKQRAGASNSVSDATVEKADGSSNLDDLFAAANDDARVFAGAICQRHHFVTHWHDASDIHDEAGGDRGSHGESGVAEDRFSDGDQVAQLVSTATGNGGDGAGYYGGAVC
ncbi:KR domain-containing protein [Triangularia setosa]|uniref:KR domain-containing protein n=1 Tax=Triangularia setosa TaxID=2587417 RepID=A0AAN6W255_9PEZI|nr:KR domain-containing protein [Podospora setosa]